MLPARARAGNEALLQAQAQLVVNEEQHEHDQAMLAAKHEHEQHLQDKRDADGQREREARAKGREQLLGASFMLGLASMAVVLGVLMHTGQIDKTSATVAGAFFAVVLQSILAQAKKK
jgi:hypothetical protein